MLAAKKFELPVKPPAIKNVTRFVRDEKERNRLHCPDESGVEVNP
jgi:hypothetical protein